MPRWIAAAATTIVATLLLASAIGRSMELPARDAALRLLPARAATHTLIIAIDEPSIAQLGRWPWSRAVLAQLIDRAADAGARAVILDILERAGMRVIEACDGHQALAVCRDHPGVDLVLSDVVMPRLGGAELARALATDAPGTKVIYMSGYPYRGVPDGRHQDLGAVLQKPFTPGELRGLIRGALRSRAA